MSVFNVCFRLLSKRTFPQLSGLTFQGKLGKNLYHSNSCSGVYFEGEGCIEPTAPQYSILSLKFDTNAMHY